MALRIVKQAGRLAFNFAIAVTWSIAAATQTSELGGRTVSVILVNAEDLSPVRSAGEDLTLTVRPSQIGQDTNIYRLLQANGVAPDNEAFALVYDLNPTLRELRTMQPGTSLQLPRLASDSVLAKTHGGGSIAMLTVDAEIREALNRSAERLQRTASAFVQLSSGRFPPPAASDSPKEKVTSLKNWYAEIRRSFLRRTGPALRRGSLLQLCREADELNSILDAVLSKDGKLNRAHLDRITAIHEDVELEMTNYGQELANEPPNADALYKVVVNIMGGAKGKEPIRVYYTNYGLFRDPPGKDCDAFRTPGSGASELMRVQNYMIWAAQDGDPGRLVTEPLRVKVRPWDSEPILVTLTARRNQR